MEIEQKYSFQVDSPITRSVYENHDNYLIEYNCDKTPEYCVIYFSSNDIYYPNTEIAFRSQLMEKNRFEWYKNRINFAYKHIFIRDIQKQWYLGGINSRINTPQKLLSFLEEETSGYKTIMLGSSAGGFAAVIFGQLLNVERIYSFNGQFEISTLLTKSKESIDPLIFRYRNNLDLRKWYDTRNFITNPSSIYYFHSNKSKWDVSQYSHIKDIYINLISFKTTNHGVPFLSANLPHVINLDPLQLSKLATGVHHPVLFSLRAIGFFRTALAISIIINYAIKEFYKRFILSKIK